MEINHYALSCSIGSIVFLFTAIVVNRITVASVFVVNAHRFWFDIVVTTIENWWKFKLQIILSSLNL